MTTLTMGLLVLGALLGLLATGMPIAFALGFVSIGDLVKSRFDEVEREAEDLRSYIQTA